MKRYLPLIPILIGCTGQPLEKLQEAKVAGPPEVIALEISGYAPTGGRAFRNLFVSNFSVKALRGELEYSTARDGLTDIQKTAVEPEYGFVTAIPDTNADGFSDLLMFLSGVSLANQGTLFCGQSQRISSSNDAFNIADYRLPGNPPAFLGLRDCEKNFLQLKPNSFDFDGDGILDYLEIRNGLNPKNPNDANLSISDDGVSNLEKVQRNIPVDENALSQPNKLFAYEYKTDFDASGVRTFQVKNIPILRSGIDNFIAIYITERDPVTRQDVLYSAFVVLRRPAGGTTLRFSFWGNNSQTTDTDQELLQP